MAYSSLIIGVLFILVCFNVGESLTKKLYLNKFILLSILLAMFILNFFAPITINNWQFSIAGFLIPLALSIYFVFKVGGLYGFLRVGVSALLVTTLTLIYNVISFDSYEYAYFQPYLLLAAVLGLCVYFISKSVTNSFIALFVGYSLSAIIHYLTKNIDYAYEIVSLGGEQMISMLLSAVVASLFGYYLIKKIRIMKRRRAKQKEETIIET